MSQSEALLMQVTHAARSQAGGNAIAGSVDRADAHGWIELLQCDWTTRPPQAARAAHVQTSALRIVKALDRATTGLLRALHDGEVLTVQIQMDDASSAAGQPRLLWRLDEVRLLDVVLESTSIHQGLTLLEHWTLSYAQLHLQHRLPDASVLRADIQAVDAARWSGLSAGGAIATDFSVRSDQAWWRLASAGASASAMSPASGLSDLDAGSGPFWESAP